MIAPLRGCAYHSTVLLRCRNNVVARLRLASAVPALWSHSGVLHELRKLMYMLISSLPPAPR
jgi:hypothetical protein